MRVIAGQYRSRPLKSLPGMDTRPTSDRLRETLFNVLTAGSPSALDGTRWLDLFAGAGAVGIEALSRGAIQVTFVESSRAAAKLIRGNLKSLGVTDGFNVIEQEVARVLKALNGGLDVVFLDPPYRLSEAYEQTLQSLGNSQLLEINAIVIAEHDKRFDPGDRFGNLVRYRTLKQGNSGLSFYRLQSREESEPSS